MRILQLCKKFPHPMKDGESIAVQALSRGLNDCGAVIDLLAFNTSKHWVHVDTSIRDEMSQYQNVDWVKLDNQVRPVEVFLNLFSSESYNVSRFVDQGFSFHLNQKLKQTHYDIVLIESIYMMPYASQIRQQSDARIVLRAHNVEFEIWQRLASHSEKSLYKWYFDYCAKKLKNFEVKQLQYIDLLVPITSVDRDKLLTYHHDVDSLVVPVGLDLNRYRQTMKPSDFKFKLAYIGSLDWMPNIDGLSWFIDKVMPRTDPSYELNIAGRNCPPWLQNLDKNQIKIHGEISDAVRFINSYPIFVVPLFSGSGIRVKILEAMALGKLVITTDVGIEGIEAQEDIHYLRANTADEFVRHLQSIADTPSMIRTIGGNARRLIETTYNQKSFAEQLYYTLEQLYSPQV